MYKKYSPTINAVLLSLFLLLAMSDCATVEEPVFGGTVTDVQGNVYHTVTL